MRSLFPRFVEAERRRGSVLRAFRARTAARDAAMVASARCRPAWASSSTRSAAGSRRAAVRLHGAGHADSHARWLACRGRRRRTLHVAARSSSRRRRTPRRGCSRRSITSASRSARACRTCRPRASRSPTRAAQSRIRSQGTRLRRRAAQQRRGSPRARGSRRSGQAGRPQGCVLLRAFIGGAHDPPAVDLPDDELIAHRRARALERARHHPARRSSRASTAGGTPARSTTSDTSRAWPRSRRGSRAHPGLFVAGSGFRSIGIPDCVADGRGVAAAAARLRYDEHASPTGLRTRSIMRTGSESRSIRGRVCR